MRSRVKGRGLLSIIKNGVERVRGGGGLPVHSVPMSAGVHGEGYHESSASEQG